jgi:hypothetical protein
LGKKPPMVPLFALMGIECYHHFLSNGLPVLAEETQLKQEDVKFVKGNGAWVKKRRWFHYLP